MEVAHASRPSLALPHPSLLIGAESRATIGPPLSTPAPMPMVEGPHHLVSCHQTRAGTTSGDDIGGKLTRMDQWGDLTSLSWLHNVKILPNVDQQDSLDKTRENIIPPESTESTLKQLLKGHNEGNASPTNTEADPQPIRSKSVSTAVNINFSSPPQSKVVAKKSKAVSVADNKPSSQLSTKDCQQLLFRILNSKSNVLTKQEHDKEAEVDDETVTSEMEEDVEDNENEDSVKRSRKEESNLFRSLSEEAKKQILTKKIQIQSKTSVKSLCLHFSSLTKVKYLLLELLSLFFHYPLRIICLFSS